MTPSAGWLVARAMRNGSLLEAGMAAFMNYGFKL